MRPKILALGASLRNGRWGRGLDELVQRIMQFKSQNELFDFLVAEAKIRFNQFLEAGRKDGLSFDQLYRNLKKRSGGQGLCNSEIGMTAALWGAYNVGCDISSVALSSYFTPDGQGKNLLELKKKCMSADGFLFCTPVYFGDRSSLGSDFIEFVRSDQELRESLQGKPMAGVTVGAKRNGGQETALIYQLLDMTNLGMLGVGNDSETTSQYGGTLHAGDIGTAADDEYGLNTAIGTGRRVGRVTQENFLTDPVRFKGPLRVMFWILQDDEAKGRKLVDKLLTEHDTNIKLKPEILDLTKIEIGRCLACDICPTHVGPDSEYRCINKKKNDAIRKVHKNFMDHDLIIPVIYSSNDRKKLYTVYQRFIERTRYLRRGDYLFTDTPVMPFVIEEIGARENMHIRILTSIIRHHTIMLKANIAYSYNGNILNMDEVFDVWKSAVNQSKKLAVGRMTCISQSDQAIYKPVGYVLSAARDKEISLEERKKIIQEDRMRRWRADADARLR